MGDQEINIVDIVRPVTKYAKMVTDPATIHSELETAIRLRRRAGPPGVVGHSLDVQGAQLDDNPSRRLWFCRPALSRTTSRWSK